MEPLLSRIRYKLRQYKKGLFPVERVIRDSAIFKASPFHSLTKEQANAQVLIMDKIQRAVLNDQKGQLIFVEDEAGSGKTVLLSKLFYNVNTALTAWIGHTPRNFLLVNHGQQLTVYKQIAKKLDLNRNNSDVVSKPTRFINQHDENDPVDIVLVDETHLLWTQIKQAYRKKIQFQDILKRAKVTVVIFDRHQTLTSEEYW